MDLLGSIVYQKYLHGDTISDAEVLRGIEKYSSALLALKGFGPVFQLSVDELTRVLEWLTDISVVRKL